MQGEAIRKGVYYRCVARTLAPGSRALESHPKTVNLREDKVVTALNGWIEGLFDRGHVDATVERLVGSRGGQTVSTGLEVVKRRLAEVETKLRRHQAAITAGVDPAALVDVINEAQAERAAVRAELANVPASVDASGADVRAMVDALGSLGATIAHASRERLAQIYADLRIQIRYDKAEEAVYATTSPRVVSECVRGATCALTTRLDLT